jgi:hypothetical protein
MKKSIFITVALFAFTSITNQLFAQNQKAVQGQHIKEAKLTCRVSTTETGCTIVFESSPPSSADASRGMATTKKGYDYYKAQSSFSVSAADNSVTEVKSPRDAASGQATGKRMHKPMTVSKEYDKSSPKLAESVSSTGTSTDETLAKGSGGGAGKANFQDLSVSKVNVQDLSMTKVNVQDISFTKRCGGKSTKISCDGGDCEIPIGDCPNGDCSITADWSWGMSQSGTMTAGSGAKGMSRCSIDFFLKIEDGACTAMAINEKGLPGEKKPNKTTTNNPK